MTVQGTINKSFILLAFLMVPAWFVWNKFMETQDFSSVNLYFFGGLIGGFVLVLVIVFKPGLSPFLAPLYAVCEGAFLGGLSAFFETRYPGIALQAVMLTVGIFLAMLILYSARVLRATPAFTRGGIMATGGVMIVYLIGFVMSFFGAGIPYIHGSGMIGIGFSLVVIVIAALNLILDFALIERGAEQGAPRYMEWFGAFALLVTLVWLYIEVLRLLAKLRDR